MNIFRKLYEAFFKKGNTKIASSISRSYGDLNTTDLLNLLNSIKQVSQERKDRLSEYRAMLSDGITLSAIELLAEDATQPDPEYNKSIWVSCPKFPNLENEINSFLDNNFNAETNLYAIAFNIAAFGDAYLSTFYSDQGYKLAGNRLGDYFEIETAEFITHLYHYGKPAGFLTTKNPNSARFQQDEQIILDEKDFIHFSADNGLNYGKITLQTQSQYNNSDDISEQEFTIRYGNSFLEAARSNFKTLGIFKDLMLLARLTRSQFYRLVSIDVGQADDRETTKMIKEVRDVISNSQTIQPYKSINTLSAPLSTGGNVYFPTRNGKGSVSMETIGGDFNVSEMADLDYFDNQYYGALKVPKQFLGQSEDLPAGIGESSLTRLDIRYARTVKRLQKAIKDGVKKLIIWKFNLDNFNQNISFIPPFEIRMRGVSSAENSENAELLEQNSTKIEKLLDLIERTDSDNSIDKLKLLPYLLDNLNLNQNIKKFIYDTINQNSVSNIDNKNSFNNNVDNNDFLQNNINDNNSSMDFNDHFTNNNNNIDNTINDHLLHKNSKPINNYYNNSSNNNQIYHTTSTKHNNLNNLKKSIISNRNAIDDDNNFNFYNLLK